MAGNTRFLELLEEMRALHLKKAADYGRDEDPLANVRASTDFGVPGWVGVMIRLNDKVKRLQSLAVKGELANESAEDSFIDIAAYALIARVLYEEGEGITKEDLTDAFGQALALGLLPLEGAVIPKRA